MSFVVLFSTTSFAITKHYCGDTLIDTAVFNKAETCGMEMDLDSTVEGCSVIKENCCNDEQILIDGQDEVQIQFVVYVAAQLCEHYYIKYEHLN